MIVSAGFRRRKGHGKPFATEQLHRRVRVNKKAKDGLMAKGLREATTVEGGKRRDAGLGLAR